MWRCIFFQIYLSCRNCRYTNCDVEKIYLLSNDKLLTWDYIFIKTTNFTN